MKNKELSTDQAMSDIFTCDNKTIATITGTNYNTVASWKFNYYRSALSLEKQFEILTKMGFEPKNNIKWKKQVK